MATNKLTPRLETVKVLEAKLISIDNGIWPGDAGKHLTMMAYFQFKPGQWRPPAGFWRPGRQRGSHEALMGKVCSHCCGRTTTSRCLECEGTVWKDWKTWKSKGS